jgi:hypothetical protein
VVVAMGLCGTSQASEYDPRRVNPPVVPFAFEPLQWGAVTPGGLCPIHHTIKHQHHDQWHDVTGLKLIQLYTSLDHATHALPISTPASFSSFSTPSSAPVPRSLTLSTQSLSLSHPHTRALVGIHSLIDTHSLTHSLTHHIQVGSGTGRWRHATVQVLPHAHRSRQSRSKESQ